MTGGEVSELQETTGPQKYSWFSILLIGLVSFDLWGFGHLFLCKWRLAAVFLSVSVLAGLSPQIIGYLGVFEWANGHWVMWAIFVAAFVLAVIFGILAAQAAWTSGVPEQRRLVRWLAAIGGVVVAAFLNYGIGLVIPFKAENFHIPSESMLPTLAVDDRLLSNNQAYQDHTPAIGEVAVFLRPSDGETHYIFRVIAGPGQTVQMKAGIVYVDGIAFRQEIVGETELNRFDGTIVTAKRLREYLPDGRSYEILDISPDSPGDNTRIYSVPDGHYFVLGDNRDNSSDSRMPISIGIGYVPRENFVARPLHIYWAEDLSRLGPIQPQRPE